MERDYLGGHRHPAIPQSVSPPVALLNDIELSTLILFFY